MLPAIVAIGLLATPVTSSSGQDNPAGSRGASDYQQECRAGPADACARVVQILSSECNAGKTHQCVALADLYYFGGVGLPRNEAVAATLRERACSAGDADACFQLGLQYHEGEGVPHDPARAANLFWQGCNRGHARSCVLLGDFFERGDGVQQDLTRAVSSYRWACDHEDAGGCELAARMYSQGKGVPRDPAQALRLQEAACATQVRTGDIGRGCLAAGDAYANGVRGAVGSDRIARLYAMACPEKQANSSFPDDLCETVGDRYVEGTAVSKDLAQAAVYYQRGCERGGWASCIWLGNQYAKGEGTPKNLAKAAQLYRQACELNPVDFGSLWTPVQTSEACDPRAIGHLIPWDSDRDTSWRGTALLRQACDNGRAKACEQLGNLYDNFPKEVQEEIRDDPVSGYRAAIQANPSLEATLMSNDRLARDFYEKACAAGRPGSCQALWFKYRLGSQGVGKNVALAEDRLYRAGLLYLKAGQKDRALNCVEGLRQSPNAFLAGELTKAIYGSGSQAGTRRTEQPKPPTPRAKTKTEVSGTGWSIGKGHFVTCYHVIAGARSVYVSVLGMERRVAAEVVASDRANDLALLRSTDASALAPSSLKLGQVPSPGERVFTVGYPLVPVLGGEAKVTEGIVSALSGIGGDRRTLQVTAPVQSGNSGGPLLNMRGEVVGVIVAKLNAGRIFEWTGDLPENVNYAIKVPYVEALLASNGLEPASRPQPPSRPESLEVLVRRVRPSVVLISARP